jgi:hypothetical protein
MGRYSVLAEKYSQMKEATGWAEIEGSAYVGAQRDGYVLIDQIMQTDAATGGTNGHS